MMLPLTHYPSSKVEETASIDSHTTSGDSQVVSVAGPLLRQAVSCTVKGEVAKQLQRLVTGPLRSTQLLHDSQAAYSRKVAKKGAKVKQSTKIKKRVGPDGRPVEPQGRMDAFRADWMQTSLGQRSHAEEGAVQPGETLLLDVPRGAEDSLERLLFAAALRCFVPPFFRGVPGSEDSPNEDPAYAHRMYLQLPMGLAKMKYEQECRRWTQGPANRLRGKGLLFIPQSLPLSRLVMALRSVDTPKVLVDKVIELVELLQRMEVAPKTQSLQLKPPQNPPR